MLTGVRTKKIIVGADGAAMRTQAPVNVVDGDSSAVIVGRAEAGVDHTVACPAGRRGHARRGVAESMSRLPASISAPQRPAKQDGDF